MKLFSFLPAHKKNTQKKTTSCLILCVPYAVIVYKRLFMFHIIRIVYSSVKGKMFVKFLTISIDKSVVFVYTTYINTKEGLLW